jgi:hypothetical protein
VVTILVVVVLVVVVVVMVSAQTQQRQARSQFDPLHAALTVQHQQQVICRYRTVDHQAQHRCQTGQMRPELGDHGVHNAPVDLQVKNGLCDATHQVTQSVALHILVGVAT